MDEVLVIEDDDISDDGDEQHEVYGEGLVPICVPERVHDVKLGDAMKEDSHTSLGGKIQSHSCIGYGCKSTILKRNESTDMKTGNSLDTKATSFVATKMDGFSSSDSRGGMGTRDHHSLSRVNCTNDPPRLSFLSCGKQLERFLTIYQAIQCQDIADEDDDERYT